jgi:metal-responsive CopG/Arc/MetJ family transcriptional regulator
MFGSGSKISLDSDLLKRCRDHAKMAGYSSVEEFIQHALETALRKTATGAEDDPRVLERLKGLGYIE